DALVSEPGRPRPAGLRSQPADAQDHWGGRPRTELRRLPYQRRRDEEPGDRASDAARRGHRAGRPDELVLLYAQPDVRVARPAHDLRADLSPGPSRAGQVE